MAAKLVLGAIENDHQFSEPKQGVAPGNGNAMHGRAQHSRFPNNILGHASSVGQKVQGSGSDFGPGTVRTTHFRNRNVSNCLNREIVVSRIATQNYVRNSPVVGFP